MNSKPVALAELQGWKFGLVMAMSATCWAGIGAFVWYVWRWFQ